MITSTTPVSALSAETQHSLPAVPQPAAALICRVEPALASLELLFRPSGQPSLTTAGANTSSTMPGAGSTSTPAAPLQSATQLAAQSPLVLSIAFLEEEGGIKAAFLEQHSGSESSARMPGRQQRRLSKKRQLDSEVAPIGQQQQQQQQQAQHQLLPALDGMGGAGASGGGRKRRRISSTAAAHDFSGSRAANSAAAAAAGGVSGQAHGPPPEAGSRPAAVCGWGVEEAPREFSCRTRRRLLLYLKVNVCRLVLFKHHIALHASATSTPAQCPAARATCQVLLQPT
jgi:hypothetical protein